MNFENNLAAPRRVTSPLIRVTPGQGQRLEPSPAIQAVAPGRTLLQAGQYGPLWRVTSGAFRVERQGDGAHTLIQIALPGDRIGLESLFGQPYAVTVSALVASTACAESVASEATRLAVLADILAQQQRQAQDMARLRSGSAADRVVWLVQCLGGDIDDPAARKALPPLKEMAQIIDTAAETICRELGRLMPSQKAPRRRARATPAPLARA